MPERPGAPTIWPMHRTVPALALAVLAGGALAAAPASAGAEQTPCTKATKKQDRRRSPCSALTGARFRLVAATVDGTITVRQSDGDHTFAADGTSRYVVRPTATGTPFRIAAPVGVGAAGPVTWTAATTATWADDRGREDCSRTAAPDAAPARFGGAFAPSRDGRSVTVQWALVNEGWACPTGIATIGELPAAAMTTTHPVARFAATRITLPIAIDHRWRPDDMTDVRVTWKGTVTLRRLG
jgi:hypothetical protein